MYTWSPKKRLPIWVVGSSPTEDTIWLGDAIGRHLELKILVYVGSNPIQATYTLMMKLVEHARFRL